MPPVLRLPVLLLVALLLAARPTSAQPAVPSADLVLGIAAYNKGDFAGAFRLLNAAAASGEAEAMVNLGYLYARGQGVRADSAFALQLYRRAAEAGDPEGMNAVGFRYNFAAPPDYPNAIRWYCRAILRGNPRAMNNAAILFFNGQGIPRDRDEARSLWAQSAKLGHLNGMSNLGADIAGDATMPDAERAAGRLMVRRAAEQGSALAQDILRRWGDSGPFPPAFDASLAMKIEPRDPPPGASIACESLIS